MDFFTPNTMMNIKLVKYNFLNHSHYKPFDLSSQECLMHFILSSGETPQSSHSVPVSKVPVEISSHLRASGSSSSSVSPPRSYSPPPVSRSHFIAVEETIQDVLNAYNNPKGFRFFTETFYQHPNMPKNWWLSSRTEKDTKKVFWYLKKDPFLMGNEIIYYPTEGSRAILDELKQHGILLPDGDLSKLNAYAEFETFRLLWKDPKIFMDVARFGENDYYALVTSKEPIIDSVKLRSQGNTKIVEYLQTIDPSRIQEGVELRHYAPSPFHFERFPSTLISGAKMKKLLEDYGPKSLVEFLRCRDSLHEFFGQDSPFEYISDDDDDDDDKSGTW